MFMGGCIGLFFLMSFCMSRKGKWHLFTMRYPVQTKPTGVAYTSPCATFGSGAARQFHATYKNMVRVIFTDTGICFYVKPTSFWRIFHPPFLLPWQKVRQVEQSDGIFREHYELRIEDHGTEITLVLPTKVEHDLFRYYKAA
jgi:hypothetical protein